MFDPDPRLRDVLSRLEARRAAERASGLRKIVDEDGLDQKMRAIGPDAGRFLNLLARSLSAPRILELGTSFGYSGLWLADAARATGGHVTSIEFDAHKSRFAQMQADGAGLAAHITYLTGDALDLIPAMAGPFDMVFLDLWKDLYRPCLDAVRPLLSPGALIVADNMGQKANAGIDAYAARLKEMPEITSVLVSIGSGMELSRYDPV